MRDLADVLKSRHGTADSLVGKLRRLAEHERPEDEPLDATDEDVKTLGSMIADEPIMQEPPYRHLAAQIETAILRQPPD